MKLCLGCGSSFTAGDWSCPGCGFTPIRNGKCLVLLAENQPAPAGYDASFFPEIAKLEDRSFWFRSRTRLIVWAMRKYFPAARTFLEVGCGTGCVLAGMAAAFPGLALHASEPFSEGLWFAQQRVPGATFLQLDARNIPFRDEFDVIGAFDVLEHIEDDLHVLAQMHQAVAPGGGVLLTVPQHEFLWSRQDDEAGHVRRYKAADLRDKLTRTGFRVRRMTSFVSSLLPAMLLSRVFKARKGAEFDALDELRIGAVLNGAMGAAMDLETALIRAGVSFPAGGSLLVAAEKP
jgi:SAM-dependent methyltransferase